MKRLSVAGILLTLILVYSCQSGTIQPTRTDLSSVALEMEQLLLENMMPAWYPRVIDQEYGGFLSDFDYKWELTGKQQKMIVTQARHIWTCSKMAAFTGDTIYLSYAKHGFQFLKNVMWDQQDGGFYNLVTQEGIPVAEGENETLQKNAYGNAFAIYALSAYYKESKDTAALNLAKRTFYWLEKHSFDPVYGGYFQFLKKDGTPLQDGFRSTPPKDQNSSIHLMEAFAELYQVWPDGLVRSRLNGMLRLIRDLITHEKGYLQLYLDKQLIPLSYRDSSKEVHQRNYLLDHISFGHDVETAYLLMETSEVLNIQNDEITKKIAKKMVDHVLNKGWDQESAGIFDAGYYYMNKDSVTILRDSKNWWAQAETMNTLLIMSDMYPDDPMNYSDHFLEQWQFIKANMVDWEHGGWYAGSIDKEPEMKEARKSQIWKGNYHTVRSLMNCINRINQANQH